jgi:hypothetical protein
MASRRQAWRFVSIATWMSGPPPGASFGGVARLTVSVCDIGAITAGLAADAADGPESSIKQSRKSKNLSFPIRFPIRKVRFRIAAEP